MREPAFSRRLNWSAPPNRLSVALTAMRAAGTALLDLTESNPTRCGIAYPKEILPALTAPAALRYEPAPLGMQEARAAVARYYAERPAPAARHVAPEQIVLTASTSESYAWLFGLLADPGDAILIPQPSYPLFDHLCGLAGLEARPYALVDTPEGWMIDQEALQEAWEERARAIVVVNPNNPTGSFLRARDRAFLLDWCARRGGALIVDEVFADFPVEPHPDAVATLAGEEGALVFVLGGLSKAAGLPQMKVGWMVVSAPAALREAALARLEWIADTYLSVSTPAQCALPAWLQASQAVRAQLAARIRANRRWLRERLRDGRGCQALPVEGGWYATLRLPQIHSSEEWTLEFLKQEHVLVQPGYFFDFPRDGYAVVSLITAEETFREGVERLERRVQAELERA